MPDCEIVRLACLSLMICVVNNVHVRNERERENIFVRNRIDATQQLRTDKTDMAILQLRSTWDNR